MKNYLFEIWVIGVATMWAIILLMHLKYPGHTTLMLRTGAWSTIGLSALVGFIVLTAKVIVVPSPRDLYRLDLGNKAAEITDDMIATATARETLEQYRSTLHDGIAALQSLDDLGAPEDNQRAWDAMLVLQKRYEDVAVKLNKPIHRTT